MDNELYSMETCDVCKSNKYGAIKQNGLLIHLRVVRNFTTLQPEYSRSPISLLD